MSSNRMLITFITAVLASQVFSRHIYFSLRIIDFSYKKQFGLLKITVDAKYESKYLSMHHTDSDPEHSYTDARGAAIHIPCRYIGQPSCDALLWFRYGIKASGL